MKALEASELIKIADARGIDYSPIPSPFNRNAVISRMSRTFPVALQLLYDMIADVGSHSKYFPHLLALNVLDNSHLANVIGDNQAIVVEGLAEGGSKLGVKLFTFFPPNRIEGELMTDPFISAGGRPSGTNRSDPKKGTIVWNFSPVDANNTLMAVESDFDVGFNTAYLRGAVDHVWMDFFENLMVQFNELKAEDKLCAPF